MKVKFLKTIKGTWHTIAENDEFTVPYKIEQNKRTMSLEIITSELWKAGFFLSFSSSSKNANDGYAGCGSPLKLNEDFAIIDNNPQNNNNKNQQLDLL